MYIRHILLANRSKSCKGCCLICVCFVTGVEMNLSHSASKLMWSFVSSLFESFFMFFFVSLYCDICTFLQVSHHFLLLSLRALHLSISFLSFLFFLFPRGPWADIISSSGLINWSSGTMRSTIDPLSLNLAKLLIPLRNPPSHVGWLLILCSFWLFLAVHYVL